MKKSYSSEMGRIEALKKVILFYKEELIRANETIDKLTLKNTQLEEVINNQEDNQCQLIEQKIAV